ncbi:unnamed protein product [Microthlaspi erraticum]|uniref:F-box domain-containing protein n=1 Tax=Microthlaspi erraticum TaxID=1685480 RepID=A0A6D2KUY3_9BRAS|nr:unnamed protein product [Microthlaspi erraticum]CAA7051800.1 unnamed protein product [Microthlaspi erraticum]
MMNSLPTDLFLEIFSRLPAKSVAKCLFVSKQWASILGGQDFTELFLTRSSTRPRLLFAIKEVQNSELHFFSSPQPQNPYEKSSLVVVSPDSHIKFPKGMHREFCGHTSGLIFIHGNLISNNSVQVISNPSTGQCASLPKLKTTNVYSKSYLGFDPIGKQFKVLCIDNGSARILTLGTGKMTWRNIQYSLTHEPLYEGICINEVLYYVAQRTDETSYGIVCFDVRSEKFNFINTKIFYKLINYKGKLGRVGLDYIYDGGSCTIELRLLVLEDVEKGEWSDNVYFLRDDKFLDGGRSGFRYLDVAGATAMGDIVLSMANTSKRQFYVFYFNPERKTLQSVEIQGFGDIFFFLLNCKYHINEDDGFT